MIRNKGSINWTAVAAVGTLLAVLWAVYSQQIKLWIDRPVLEFKWFEPNSPHLIDSIWASNEITGPKEYAGQFIAINLVNTGNMVAKDAQPFLMKVGSKDKDGKWILNKKWIPIPLQWVLPSYRVLERDLVPHRPYLFYVGSFSIAREGKLLLTYSVSPKSQREIIEPGEHCFEISAFSVGAEKETKYIYLKYEHFKDETDQKINVSVKSIEMKNEAPW